MLTREARTRSGRNSSEVVKPGEGGFSLIEVVVATVIAVIVVLGLAHTFAVGRGLMDGFRSARDAMALAERRLELLEVEAKGSPFFAPGLHGPTPVPLNSQQTGSESWNVVWVDDPVDGLGAGDSDPNDYKRVTVIVGWVQGAVADSIQLSRTFLAY